MSIVQYIGTLLRDAFLWAPAALALLLFVLDWGWRIWYRATFPVPLWLYPGLLLLGFVVSAYRMHRRQQFRIQELEAASAEKPLDTQMNLATFDEMVKPDQTQNGWEVKLPAPDKVRHLLMEGWEVIPVPDQRGHPLRAVIVDSHGQIELIPVRRRLPAYEVSALARRLLLEADSIADKSLVLLHYDQGDAVLVAGHQHEGWEAITAVRQLATRRYIQREEGNRYVVSAKGAETAARLREVGA